MRSALALAALTRAALTRAALARAALARAALARWAEARWTVATWACATRILETWTTFVAPATEGDTPSAAATPRTTAMRFIVCSFPVRSVMSRE